jgi:hypothetical protein
VPTSTSLSHVLNIRGAPVKVTAVIGQSALQPDNDITAHLVAKKPDPTVPASALVIVVDARFVTIPKILLPNLHVHP